MMKQLFRLEWKQFFRSKALGQSLAVKIVMGFLALYFTVSFLLLGFGAFYIIRENLPGQDPLILVNNYLLYWFVLDLVYRFMLQKMPVMNIQPFMILPIKKSRVIHYLLMKTSFSFFNILPLFFFIPFTIVLWVNAYPVVPVLLWFIAMIALELCVNYLNFLINKIPAVFYVILTLLLTAAALQYFGIYGITQVSGLVFNSFYQTSYTVLIPVILAVWLYRKNYGFLSAGFYLDDKIQKRKEKVKSSELSWLDRFGDMAVFLKNDIRMISRNKRPRQVLLTSVLFLFYGLIFFTQDMYVDSYIFIAFASIFVSGGFLLTFGQLVPAWDSEYYKLLMSQNIPYRKYLESKWYLMVTGTLLSFILCIPYLYFGWKIFLVICAVALFNVGLNSYITLWGGALNRTPVELNAKAKAFSNTQGFNMTQLLVALPKMLLPVLLFYLPAVFISYWAGLLALVIAGLSGLVLKRFFLGRIEQIYQRGKYKTIEAFAEKK